MMNLNKANTILSVIVSIISIISALLGCTWYLHDSIYKSDTERDRRLTVLETKVDMILKHRGELYAENY